MRNAESGSSAVNPEAHDREEGRLDYAEAWEDASQILVSIVGGEDLIAADFEWLMSQVQSRAPRARLGRAAAQPRRAGRVRA